MTRRFLITIAVVLWGALSVIVGAQTDDVLPPALSASALFNKYRSNVYQIRVINDATGQKTTIGSGFVVGDGTLLATNYHVVSNVIQKDNHHLEYVASDDRSGPLSLVDVDVIHDLALVRAEQSLGTPMILGGIPDQGAPLFSLGNPHDLGFIIIDGINNGLLKKFARARILFSASLNAGMSGGPTLNRNGEVVGVNVSHMLDGSNISFLVPATYLAALLKKSSVGAADINTSITEQLFTDNRLYFKEGLKNRWPTTTIGQFVVPLAMNSDVRCWDSSPDADEEEVIEIDSIDCLNDRNTFINDAVIIGQFGYTFTRYHAREPILSARFYRLYSQTYNLRFNARPLRDYGDFSCRTNFVAIAGKSFKLTLCRQPSKHFHRNGEAIEDIRAIAAWIGAAREGFRIKVALNGVQPSLGNKVIAHLLEQISWKK